MAVDEDTLARAQRGEPGACREITERFAGDVLARVGGDEAAAATVLAAVIADLPRYALGADKLEAWVRTRADRHGARIAAEAGAAAAGAAAAHPAPDAAPAPATDRLVDRVMAERPPVLAAPPRRSRNLGVIAAVVSVSCIAALVVAFIRTTPAARRGAARGDAVATERTSVAISRGVAVVEAGGAIHWDGARVSQPVGNVFYRVEPGGDFTVTTPHGAVTTTSACLRIEVGASSTAITIAEGAAVVGATPATAGARVVLP